MHLSLSLCLGAAVTVTATSNEDLSAVSWDKDRLDVFGIGLHGNIWHKYWTPAGGFEPHKNFEDLGGNLTAGPAAVSWAAGRLDLFAVNDEHGAVHTYWDGGSWAKLEQFDGVFEGKTLAATSWSTNRLDVVGIDENRTLSHMYWDGTKWVTWASFGGKFAYDTEPSVVSWGENRLDIFGIDEEGRILHQYWSGDSWLADWEVLDSGLKFVGTPVSTSMTPGRLDLWVVAEDGDLYHAWWTPGHFYAWEGLGGYTFDTAPQVIHWSNNRIDIVGKLEGDNQYRYKYWDGSQWNPSLQGWDAKGGDFASQPALTSRGDGNLNIFGIDSDGQLRWQFWNEGQWLPSFDDYYSLGNIYGRDPPTDDGKHFGGDSKDDVRQVVLNGYKEEM